MSNDQLKNEWHRIIFADRKSLTPNENDVDIKRKWIEILNENRNEGVFASDGTIAWDCPCLGTQAIGPCSAPFRMAFSCYQTSTRKPKGSECVAEWMKMQHCFAQYPTLYGKKRNPERQTNEAIGTIYGHPEARRQRLKEERKANIESLSIA